MADDHLDRLKRCVAPEPVGNKLDRNSETQGQQLWSKSVKEAKTPKTLIFYTARFAVAGPGASRLTYLIGNTADQLTDERTVVGVS